MSEIINLAFPVRGIDQTQEAASQPGDTTPTGKNVRVCDRATLRLRGASRPGLSKLVSAQPNGTSLIQHLEMIVDPTVDALFQLTPDPATAEPDPRNPGSYIPEGGTGAQPNPNNPWPLDQEEDDNWTFVQATADDFSISAPGGNAVIAFTQNVTAGDLLIIASEMGNTASSSYLNTVTDSQGNTWNRIHSDNDNGVMFWAVAGSTGANTVTAAFVVGAGTLYTVLGIAQYSGQHASPEDGDANNSATSTSLSTGSMTVSQAGTLVVGAFFLSRIIASEPAIPDLTAGTGMNERMESSFTNGTFDAKIGWFDGVVDANSAVTATASASYLYTACGSAFKPA